MNDKIKELVIKAIKQTSDDEASKLYIGDEFANNFAKLIIEECVDNLFVYGYDDAADQLDRFYKNKFGSK